MHCGLELHCLRALGRATVKTLLPRSNAVITRHWGLSHPLQIKPRTGNTQVIRGLLFCISARCQSLAVRKKKRKNPDSLCDGWGRVENRMPAERGSQDSGGLWSMPGSWNKQKKTKNNNNNKNIHTVVCMCKPTYWHYRLPLILCRVLALTIQAEVETILLCLELL